MDSRDKKQSPFSLLARKAQVVAGATFISRILGFARDLIIAFTLGAGPLADAFFVAFRIPNLLRRLFAEGSLTMAFVPVFTKIKNAQGELAAFVLARSVQIWLLIILGGISVLALVFASPLTMLVAPGFRDDPELFQDAVTLVRICFPYILFISSVALCMGILNSMNHFLAPALAPGLMNVVLILFALGGYFSGANVAIALSLGVLVAGFFQWAFQYPFLKRFGFSWKGKFSLKDPGVLRIGKLMLPTVLGAAVYQLNILAGTILASFLASGSIAYLYYADRLVQFPLGVFAVAISTAALPSLSALAGDDKISDFKQTLNSSLCLTLFIALPSTAGLIGLNYPLIDVIFGRGEFGAQAVDATALALVGFAVGLPAFSCVRPLISAFYALEDTVTPVKMAIISLVLNVLLGIVLMQYLQHFGLALAASLSSWVNVLLLGCALSRKIGTWLTSKSDLGKMLLLSCALLLLLKFVNVDSWMALGLIPLCAALYFTASVMLKIPEAKMLLKTWTKSNKQT